MNNPFKNNHESMDQSVWADWLSDNSPAQPKKVNKHAARPASRPYFPNTFPSQPQSTRPNPGETNKGPKPLIVGHQAVQDQRMHDFLSKQPLAAKQPEKATQKPSNRKEIAVSISLPDLSPSRLKKWRLSSRLIKRMAIVAGLGLIVGLMVLTPKIINSNDKIATESSAGGTKSIPKSFAELTPEETANVTNERYDSSRGFYTFNDRYRGGNVTVTEQQLPDDVRDNAEKGKQLAQSVGATDDYETTQGMLYLTLSDTKTAQRAVLLHRQLLVFIQSTEPMTPTTWVDYVQSLQ